MGFSHRGSSDPARGAQYPEAPGSVAGTRMHFLKPEDAIEVLVDGYPVKIPKRMTVLQSMASFGDDGCRFTAVKRSVVDKNLGILVKTRCIQCTRSVFATKVSGYVIDTCHAVAFKGRNREFDSLFWTSGSVYRNEFLFLWDTGASVSTVDVRVVDMLHLRYEKCHRSIWVLGGSEAEILGVCRLTWMMGGVRFGHEFEIMRTFDKSFTLGTDFMRRFKVVSFHFDEKEVTAITKDNKTLKFTCVQ